MPAPLPNVQVIVASTSREPRSVGVVPARVAVAVVAPRTAA